VSRFGTDGIRGPSGRPPITVETGLAVGRAAARLAAEAGGELVVIGRDTRPSGAALQAAVAAGVAGQGLRAVVAGVIPTSGVATVAAAYPGATGVVVTASHNPAGDNGFKVLAPGGRKLTDGERQRVEGWLDAPPGPSSVGRVDEAAEDVRQAYTVALRRAAGDLRPLAGRRIAVDLANGAATALAGWLAEAVPAHLVLVGGGEGPINEDCGAVHPERLAAAVRESGCAGGIALDGDADRCVLVDEHGVVVPGDALAWWLATATAAPVLAVTVMSSAALEPSLPGVRVIRTPVGDRHLQRAIREEGAALGCEESGHVLFADGLPAGDGLVTGLRALASALERKGSVSAAMGGFTPFPRRLTRVPVTDRRTLQGIAPLQDAVGDAEAALGPGGRVFLRYSGTEPVLRLLVEGADEAVVARVSETLTRAAREVWR